MGRIKAWATSLVVLVLLGFSLVAQDTGIGVVQYEAAAYPIADLRRSVFVLHAVYDGPERERHCTAFVVAEQRLLTAAHCVKDNLGVHILDEGGNQWEVQVVRVWAELDIAELRSDVATPSLQLGVDPVEDAEVLALSNSGGHDMIFSLRGRVAGKLDQYFVAQMFGQTPGFSGGPALCGADYRVCGIFLGYSPRNDLTMVLPVSAWRDVLQEPSAIVK